MQCMGILQEIEPRSLGFEPPLYGRDPSFRSLLTYGESGQVCQNWMQYRLIKQYLERMTDEQTLAVSSGHPLGLLPSHKLAPRAIRTNGLMVAMYDTLDGFHRAAAMGITNSNLTRSSPWSQIRILTTKYPKMQGPA
ncbi:MAG: hypothetical protein EAX95_00185 [Candidatus Thorarchaeota archaeon]|nr:hypothetical protein [Candidatus Thorarchaeota archaeon]